jgi:uncharacterized membrane protein YfcA
MARERKAVRLFLQWLAVVPGSIIAMILSTLPLHLVLYQTLTGSGLVEPYPELPERLLGPMAASLAFVWTGARIAPSRKTETAVAMFGVVLFLVGGSFALGLSGAHIGNVTYSLRLGGLPSAGGIVGAFIGLWLVRREDSASGKSKIPV